ncbi:hypothetical protein [Robertkochia solimangrovi]|uniref:hypothetical protein n=1 Tax=Robertkochia solimangrovi TaxID=2213046 RepID=UPI001180ABEE|nr:hypothetical protein [Robertkochia solimangrovi]TRZ45985.1 hypothetical protein DMZ48_01565 [Robertkochia solimangrovi]
MKKIFALFLTTIISLGMNSCDLDDDDSANFHFETLETLSAELPESFDYGQVYRINVDMLRPSDCHYFEGFDYNHTDKTVRTIYPIASVIERNDCNDLEDSEMTQYFDFEVRFTDTYTFRFYTGTNEAGEDEFIEYEVPVNQ